MKLFARFHTFYYGTFIINTSKISIIINSTFQQEFTVRNIEHLDQQGLPIPANQITHNLSRADRLFVVLGADVPGVEYSFELKLAT